MGVKPGLDLVGKPEDRFSYDQAYIIQVMFENKSENIFVNHIVNS